MLCRNASAVWPAPGRSSGVFGVAQRGVDEQRPDRGEAGVAGAWAVMAFVFEMIEERRHRVGIEVGPVQPRWRRAGAPCMNSRNKRQVSR